MPRKPTGRPRGRPRLHPPRPGYTSRGRPPRPADAPVLTAVQVRLPPAELAALDGAREGEESRAAALLRVVRRALGV